MKIVRLDELPEEGVSHDPKVRKKVIIRKGQIPALTNFSQVTLKVGQVSPGHTHTDMVEVFLVESGIGQMGIDG